VPPLLSLSKDAESQPNLVRSVSVSHASPARASSDRSSPGRKVRIDMVLDSPCSQSRVDFSKGSATADARVQVEATMSPWTGAPAQDDSMQMQVNLSGQLHDESGTVHKSE